MLERNLSRRGFLAGAAASAAVIGTAGYMSFADWNVAHAADAISEPTFAGHSAGVTRSVRILHT